MHRFPVTAAVSEMLPLLQQRLHQRTANAGVAVSVDSVGEPSARHADLLAVLPLDHAISAVVLFVVQTLRGSWSGQPPLQYLVLSGDNGGSQPALGVNKQIAEGMV